MNKLFKQDLAELLYIRAELQRTKEMPTKQLELIDKLVVLTLNMDQDAILEVINANHET